MKPLIRFDYVVGTKLAKGYLGARLAPEFHGNISYERATH